MIKEHYKENTFTSKTSNTKTPGREYLYYYRLVIQEHHEENTLTTIK